MNDSIPCPRCNSQQKFTKRYRKVGTRPWLEVFVACTLCRWENILGKTTQQIEDTKAQMTVVAQKRAYQEALHGQASESMLNIEQRVAERLELQQRRLRREVADYGSSAD